MKPEIPKVDLGKDCRQAGIGFLVSVRGKWNCLNCKSRLGKEVNHIATVGECLLSGGNPISHG
jgi:hypothetical protein